MGNVFIVLVVLLREVLWTFNDVHSAKEAFKLKKNYNWRGAEQKHKKTTTPWSHDWHLKVYGFKFIKK